MKPENQGATPSIETKTQDMLLYDAAAVQRIEFDGFNEETITAIFTPVNDDVYLSTFDARAKRKFTDNGTSLILENNEAFAALFDAVVSDIEGIPGDKPNDWKQQLDTDQVKNPIMSQFLGVACYEEAFSWGQTNKAIISEAYFNNDVVKGKHFLRKKLPEDVNAYRNLQKIPLGTKGKGLKGADVVIPTYTKLKARLYDQMQEKPAEGYAGPVPIWHKVAVIEFIFSAGVSGKK